MNATLPLRMINPGSRATVVRVGGAPALRRRFAEMGIVPGASIQVERVAPLGDPIAYRIRGYRLSLRREEAAQIEVMPEAPAAHG